MNKFNKGFNKKGFMLDNLGWAIFAIAILLIIIIGVLLLLGKGTEMLNTLKEIFRFR